MSAEVISLLRHRRNHAPNRACGCDSTQDWVCYPHRLVDLAARIEDLRGDVEMVRFLDYNAFERLVGDVLGVIDSITTDCEPGERPDDERTAR